MGLRYATGRLYKPRVRGISSPLDIDGCQLWLDFSDSSTLYTDAGVTNVTADNDLIYQANDKSGNEYHATQTTEANRPLYRTSVKNGLNVGSFIGDFMNLPDALRAQLTESMTFFSLVYQLDIGSRNGVFGSAYWSSNGFNYGRHDSNKMIFTWGNSLYQVSNTSISVDTWYSVGYKFDQPNTSFVHYINGNADGVGSPEVTIGTVSTLQLVHNTYGDANQYMAEIVCYTPSLSDADRLLVEAYLNNKWNIY